jgi:hypothetical protein
MFHRRVVSIAVLIMLAAVSVVPAGAAPPASGGVPVVVKQTPHCSAYAPSDWSISSNPQASALDLQSPDGTMYAGWGVTAINRAQERFYGPMYSDPDTSIRTLASMIVGKLFSDSGGVRFTTAPAPFLNYFTIRHIASARTAGVVFYHIYPGASPQYYTESVYFAIVDASVPRARHAIAPGVAVSIRCATQLIPSQAPDVSRTGKKGRPRPGCGGEPNLRGYNMQLGTQYAHTAAGDNFLYDVADYRSTGPDGPGYYKMLGNSLTKLEPGRSDDGC